MTADDPRPAGEACCKPGDLTCRNWRQCARFQFRPAASGGATDREREHRTLDPICSACVALTDGGWQCDPARLACPYWPTGDSDPAPVASQADGELREEIYQVLWPAGQGDWDGLRERIGAQADAVLALPAVRQLLADAAAVQRVRASHVRVAEQVAR